jgi:hypothetical protein
MQGHKSKDLAQLGEFVLSFRAIRVKLKDIANRRSFGGGE